MNVKYDGGRINVDLFTKYTRALNTYLRESKNNAVHIVHSIKPFPNNKYMIKLEEKYDELLSEYIKKRPLTIESLYEFLMDLHGIPDVHKVRYVDIDSIKVRNNIILSIFDEDLSRRFYVMNTVRTNVNADLIKLLKKYPNYETIIEILRSNSSLILLGMELSIERAKKDVIITL